MKYHFALAAFTISLFAIGQEGSEPAQSGARLVFFNQSHDFGEIIEGEVVEHVFEFENGGNQPLILSNVLTTCGCTASDWPREPIMPGASASVKVTFNSKGKPGMQKKIITVLSNAVNNTERISITTNVTPKSKS